jgi:mannose-6-phosphate isomerase-like protein (cupin superfamily)
MIVGVSGELNNPFRYDGRKSETSRSNTMERKVFSEIETFSKEKHVHVPIFNSERAKVLLLCLSAGLRVPEHSHPGFDVTLQPLRGRAVLPTDEGDIDLTPGEIIVADGANSFSPNNPFDEDFEMLIHLIKR